jgi:hypothetical protein
MRRQRMIPLLLALALVAVLPLGARAQTALNGTYTLNTQQSDNVNTAIDAAVRRMNFVTRPIARGRLRKTNTAYARLEIGYTQQQVSVKYDNRAAIVTPANGTPVKWRREDGEQFDVSTEWENGRLEQTFAAEDGRRVNVYTLSADNQTLTMDVTITSPKLAAPLRYKLVYNRA